MYHEVQNVKILHCKNCFWRINIGKKYIEDKTDLLVKKIDLFIIDFLIFAFLN